MRIAAPAERVQIRLSNEFGDKPLRLGAVHVALAAADGAIMPGSDHALTFYHQSAVDIPAGAPLLSDPLDWKIPALTRLAVSVSSPGTVPPAHRVTEWVSSPGDYTEAERMPGASTVRSGALVTEVQIVSPAARRVVVALGDSITEGARSTVNGFRSWPDRLAERLSAGSHDPRLVGGQRRHRQQPAAAQCSRHGRPRRASIATCCPCPACPW